MTTHFMTPSSSPLTSSLSPFQTPILSASTHPSALHIQQGAAKMQQAAAEAQKAKSSILSQQTFTLTAMQLKKSQATYRKKRHGYPGCLIKKRCPLHKTVYPCKFQSCFQCPLKGGFCRSHGGGQRCTTTSCSSFSVYMAGKCYPMALPSDVLLKIVRVPARSTDSVENITVPATSKTNIIYYPSIIACQM